MSDLLHGEVTSISKRFWSEGWGFGQVRVMSIESESFLKKGDTIKITGPLQGLTVGDHVVATGDFTEDSYGVSFKCKSVLKDTPRDKDSAKRWIIDTFPQIGPQRATEMIRKFGDRIWDVIETTPRDLCSIKGITAERADEIAAAWTLHKSKREKHMALYAMGLTQREASLVDKTDLTLEEIKKEPFFLYLMIPSMTFVRCDLIASKAEADPRSNIRLTAAAVQATKEAAYDGHTAYDQEHIAEATSNIAEVSTDSGWRGLWAAIECDYLIVEDEMVMLPALRDAEQLIARKMSTLLNEGVRNDNNARPNAAAGSGNDDAGTRSDRDGWPGDGEEHDSGDIP
jgi:exodeoxyribonuclease V alpha subunit